ncbi:hypothetical protein BDP27DRAFT_1370947 [Rhodocollybia butyracea]|uniref:Uncharacterized protein n=1 Tax=Rhodocollybia butyracea TaxID=206335 RepID=A0A9P5P9X5_9AGAR|nr:hypothetical protein BDP27DRAFT_1370947 [Rhodocollybia butyracea]
MVGLNVVGRFFKSVTVGIIILKTYLATVDSHICPFGVSGIQPSSYCRKCSDSGLDAGGLPVLEGYTCFDVLVAFNINARDEDKGDFNSIASSNYQLPSTLEQSPHAPQLESTILPTIRGSVTRCQYYKSANESRKMRDGSKDWPPGFHWHQ